MGDMKQAIMDKLELMGYKFGNGYDDETLDWAVEQVELSNIGSSFEEDAEFGAKIIIDSIKEIEEMEKGNEAK